MNLEDRKPLWIALSDLYLDKSLQESDLEDLSTKIEESPFTLLEVKKINKYEVFPVLYPNLLSIAGEWSGFSERWLVNRINEKLDNKSYFKTFWVEVGYFSLSWMFSKDWKILENYLQNKD